MWIRGSIIFLKCCSINQTAFWKPCRQSWQETWVYLCREMHTTDLRLLVSRTSLMLTSIPPAYCRHIMPRDLSPTQTSRCVALCAFRSVMSRRMRRTTPLCTPPHKPDTNKWCLRQLVKLFFNYDDVQLILYNIVHILLGPWKPPVGDRGETYSIHYQEMFFGLTQDHVTNRYFLKQFLKSIIISVIEMLVSITQILISCFDCDFQSVYTDGIACV